MPSLSHRVGLAHRLTERGLPAVRAQLAHPTVAGIARGDLDPAVFRSWLEQDYLFLLDYVRVFSRLAWQAPDHHLGDLVDLAHSTWHEELSLHRELAGDFGADLAGATAGPATVAYTTFLLDYVRVFCRLAWQAPDEHVGDLVDLAHTTLHDELALHRSLAKPFGADLDGAVKGPTCIAYTSFLLTSAGDYGVGLAALLPCMWGYSTLGRLLPMPEEPRYRRWVETYADPAFAVLAERCAAMLDEAAPDPAAAERAFLAAMDHELAFWDVP
jgi:thiaminase/transcriptional activator TenA